MKPYGPNDNRIEKEWITKSGLVARSCIMTMMGYDSHRCGYVGVPPEHPCYLSSYFESFENDQEVFEEQFEKYNNELILLKLGNYNTDVGSLVSHLVHGGLTFSGRLKDSDLWWFGFDCAHAGDGKIDPRAELIGINHNKPISLEEVIKNCEDLASVLIDPIPLILEYGNY